MPRHIDATLNDFLRTDGWHVVGTGGGNEAWEKSVGSDGWYAWITDDDGLSLPDAMDARVLLGLYNRDGESVRDVDSFASVTDACIAIREVWPDSDPA